MREPKALRPKEGDELSAGSLQSPNDAEVTYRKKQGKGCVGYGFNQLNFIQFSDPNGASRTVRVLCGFSKALGLELSEKLTWIQRFVGVH